MNNLVKICLAVSLSIQSGNVWAQKDQPSQPEFIQLFTPKPEPPAIHPFKRFVDATVQMPFSAQIDDVEGQVMVKIRLDENRKPVAYEVKEKLRADCDQEALRVAKLIHPKYIEEFSKGNREVMIPVPFIKPEKLFYSNGFKIEYFDSFQDKIAQPSRAKYVRRYAVDSLTGRIAGDAIYFVVAENNLQAGAKVAMEVDTKEKYISDFAENQHENTGIVKVTLPGSQKFSTVADKYFTNGQVQEKTVGKTTYFYFPSGRVAKILTQMTETHIKCIDWYPSGLIRSISYRGVGEHGDLSESFSAAWDSLGNQTAVNGKGSVELFEFRNGKNVRVLAGKVVAGKKEGLWEGVDAIWQYPYKEEYNKGTLIEGVMTGEGKEFWYKNSLEHPVLSDGLEGYKTYILPYIKYPIDAYVRSISGKTYIAFAVDEEGNVTDIGVRKSLYEALDRTAMKAIARSSGHWNPAQRRGKAVKFYPNVMAINFVSAE